VSKHLGVLKQVELVSETRAGRQRMYRINGEQLKPIYDWVAAFERHWSERFNRLDAVLSRIHEEGD
jgi:DNA-binding transcriptional ArsR family regulator